MAPSCDPVQATTEDEGPGSGGLNEGRLGADREIQALGSDPCWGYPECMWSCGRGLGVRVARLLGLRLGTVHIKEFRYGIGDAIKVRFRLKLITLPLQFDTWRDGSRGDCFLPSPGQITGLVNELTIGPATLRPP